MELVFLIIYLSVFALIIIDGLRHKGGCYEFPFLLALVLSAYCLGGMIIYTKNNDILPQGAISRFMLMSSIVLIASYYSFKAAKNRKTGRLLVSNKDIEFHLLLKFSIAYIIIGTIFYIKLLSLDIDISHQHWEGIAVRYVFFTDLIPCGVVISFLLYLVQKNKLALFGALLSLPYYAIRLIIQGRRSVIAELALIILISIWFQYRKAIPRIFFIVVFLLAVVFSASTHSYRMAMATFEGPDWEEALEIPYFNNWLNSFEDESTHVENAAMRMEAVSRTMQYDYGLFNWNELASHYVPRQLVGEELKQSFMFDLGNPLYEVFGYVHETGTTFTGMCDSYCSFGYTGFIKYVIIGYLYCPILSSLFNS